MEQAPVLLTPFGPVQRHQSGSGPNWIRPPTALQVRRVGSTATYRSLRHLLTRPAQAWQPGMQNTRYSSRVCGADSYSISQILSVTMQNQSPNRNIVFGRHRPLTYHDSSVLSILNKDQVDTRVAGGSAFDLCYVPFMPRGLSLSEMYSPPDMAHRLTAVEKICRDGSRRSGYRRTWKVLPIRRCVSIEMSVSLDHDHVVDVNLNRSQIPMETCWHRLVDSFSLRCVISDRSSVSFGVSSCVRHPRSVGCCFIAVSHPAC